MATAGQTVIVEADEISEEPLAPSEVVVAGLYVDYLVTKEAE